MSALLEKLRKNSTIKESDILSHSKFFNKKDMIQMSIPIMNVALSGELGGGFVPGLTMWAGPSKHFKTLFSLIMAKAYMDRYPEAVLLFYDSEFGTPKSYFTSIGIDMARVLHAPLTNIEQLKFDIMTQFEGVARGDRLMVVIDSIGNLASKKEVDDALDGKSVADMTRAKQLKSLFRMVTPHLNLKDIPMVVVNHTYKEIGLYPKDIVGGGCVDPETKIRLSNGSLKAIKDISVGDEVYTLLGGNNVTHVWNEETLVEGTPDCYLVTFSDGSSVICSDSHRFMDLNGEWVDVDTLNPGDVLMEHPPHVS